MRPSRHLVLVLALAVAAGARAQGSGGGNAAPAPPAGLECVTPAEQAGMVAVRALAPARPARPAGVLTTLYADPMSGGINSFGRTVTNYVDLDATAGLKDWSCGTTTYDGHTGDDIEIRDFYDMDAGVPILCAASGTVVSAHDGEYDRQTQWLSGVTANSVVVQHADGSTAYYWHMRRGSVRGIVGHAVVPGDTLGMVGSSGFSSGPHLHFETYDAGTKEAYAGACQVSGSRWISQGSYVWSLPVQVFGNGVTTITPTWPLLCERPPSKTHVTAGGNVYSWIRARNLATTNLVTWNLYSPLGLYGTYSFHPGSSYSSSWWYVYWTLTPSSTLYGAWHFDILVDGALAATQAFSLNAAANKLPTVSAATLWAKAGATTTFNIASSDSDGTVFWHNLGSGPVHGTAVLDGTRRHLLEYSPTPGYLGPDSLTVYATDDENANGAARTIRITVTDQLAVPEAGASALSLAPPAPNPAAAGTRLAFTLPQPGEARIELLDVGGRRIAAWAATGLAAGEHAARWSELTRGASVAPGLYFVRLSAAGETRMRRVCVIQ